MIVKCDEKKIKTYVHGVPLRCNSIPSCKRGTAWLGGEARAYMQRRPALATAASNESLQLYAQPG